MLASAIAIADAGGLDSLSMRKLAKELGVEAMSLYHYVSGKDELFDAMVDAVLGEIEHPAAEEPWKPALRKIALSYRKALAAHPWAAGLAFARGGAPGEMPNRKRNMEAMLRTISQAGLSAELTDLAYHALESHIVGFTLWLAGIRSIKSEDLEGLAQAFLRTVSPVDFPHLVQHIHHHMAPPSKQPRSAFEFGLDLIIDGLERLQKDPSQRAAAAKPTARVRRARTDRRAPRARTRVTR